MRNRSNSIDYSSTAEKFGLKRKVLVLPKNIRSDIPSLVFTGNVTVRNSHCRKLDVLKTSVFCMAVSRLDAREIVGVLSNYIITTHLILGIFLDL